jgi:peptide/nickel transport system substrate-binding protein
MRIAVALILSAAALTACSSKESSTATDTGSGGTFIMSLSGDAVSIFPPFVNDLNGRIIQDLVFDRLAEIGQDMSTIGDKGFAPRLAKSWTWAPDSLSIAFSLDPRARWHDGKPVTAGDVRYTFSVFTDPKVGSPVAPLLTNIDSVSVKDSLTAVVFFKKHTPEEFYDVVYQLLIIPEHVYGSIPREELHTSDATRQAVGTGRFKFVKWEPGTRIELVADTGNYRGRPKLDRVVLAPVANPAAGMTQVLTEQSDFLQAYPIDQVGKLDSSTVARPLVEPTQGYTFLAMNTHDPKAKNSPHAIFSDVRVRRALSMAVDRVGSLRNVFGDKGRLGYGPFPMTIAVGDSTLKLPAYDTTAAKALLDSSGWRAGPTGIRAKNGRPLKFSVVYPTTSLPRKQYSVLLQEQFRRVGAEVEIQSIDHGAYMAKHLQPGNFDAILHSFNTDPSPSGSKQNWGTAGIGPQGQNALRYSNRVVDALLDSATSSFDPVLVKRYASRAYQQIIDDAPAIWLYDGLNVDAVHRRLNVAPIRADGWWVNLPDWSVQPDKRIDRDRIGLAPPPKP